MSRSTLPPVPEVPESTVSELHALYREAARDEPAPSLDRLILDAARAELKAYQATQSRRPAAWWKGWLPVTSAIAVALVGLSVTWRVMDEQERHLRAEMKAAEGLRERPGMTAGSAAPAQAAAETMPPLDARAPAAEKGRRADSALAKDASPVAPEPAAFPAPAVPAAMAPAPAAMPAPAAPAVMAPAPPAPAMKKTQRAEMDELRERRDAGAAADSASGPARQAGKLEAGSLGASGATAAETPARPSANSSAKSLAAPAAQSAADPATPEAWLKQIRELRAAGRSAEAVQSLARFRARYPDLVLPDDLLNLK